MVRNIWRAVVLVAQYLELIHLGTTHEDVIHNNGILSYAEACVCTTMVGLYGQLARVGHNGLQWLVDGQIGAGVEVAREEYGYILGYELLDFRYDGLHTLLLRHLAAVVEVSIEECELLARILALEQSPRAGAEALTVPTLGGCVGRSREPESTLVEQLHLVFVVEDSHKLTLLHTIVTTYAVVVEVGQILVEEIDLRLHSLLQAEDRRLLLVDHID